MKKNPDGSIETKKQSTYDRLGMSQPPIPKPPIDPFLDWTEPLPVMHGNIRCLYAWTRFIKFMKIRWIFPGAMPIMNGKYPAALRDIVQPAVKRAKKWMQNLAKDGPLKMFLETPDPTGSGKQNITRRE